MKSRLPLLALGCLVSIADTGAHGGAWRQCLTDTSPKSIEACTSIIILDPKNDGALVNRGIAYRRAGDLTRAINDFTEAIRLNPNAADAFNNRGNAYRAMYQTGPAFEDYNEAIRLNAQYAHAYNNRGIMFLDRGDFELAIADFDKAISEDASYANAYRNRGLAQTFLRLFEEALGDFDNAARLDPESRRGPEYAVALYGRGLSRQSRRDPRGTADIDEAKRILPNVVELSD